MYHKLFLSFLLTLASIVFSFSQDQIASRNVFLDAEYYFYNSDYEKALELYKNAIKANTSNANINYRIGLCYIKSENDKAKAIPFLLEAVKNVTLDYSEGSYKEMAAPVEALFYLGRAYMVNDQIDEANKRFNEFKNYLTVEDVVYIDFVDQQIKACTNAQSLYESPINITSTPLSNNINSAAPNFNPVVSSDETVLIFTSIINSNTQIQFSQKKNDEWLKPLNITNQVRSDNKCKTVSLSADGKELYILKEDNGNGSIYVSNYVNGVWTSMKKLGNNINTKSWETHACVSSDGKTLYFTSNRKGTYGGLDLYISKRNNWGDSWGSARNLGPSINSPYNEETPFITNNDNTLYFSSQGHFNIGGYDVFSATRVNNTWAVPINVGYPINTTDDNTFFVPINTGKYAYIAKSKNGHNNKDIYRISFPDIEDPLLADIPPTKKKKKDKQVLGRGINVKGILSLQNHTLENEKDFKITISDPIDSSIITEINPENNTGYFSFRLSPGSYILKFEGKDYQEQTKHLLIPRSYRRNEMMFNTELIPNNVAASSFLTIKSVSFENSSYSLTEDAQSELQRLHELMSLNPSLEIKVTRHSEKNNKELSAERVNSIIQFISQKGINENRFIIETEEDSHKHYPDEDLNRVDLKVSRSDQDIFVIYERGGFRKGYRKEMSPAIKDFSSKTFTLLLLTVATPIDVNFFSELQNIKISIGNDNYYWYTYEEYSSYETAKEAREKLVKYGNKYQNIFIKETKSIPNY